MMMALMMALASAGVQVTLHVNGVHLVVLPTQDFRNLTVTGSEFKLSGNEVILLNSTSATITYFTTGLSLNFSSPTPMNMTLLIPSGYEPYSVFPEPASVYFHSGGIYMSFYTPNVTVILRPLGQQYNPYVPLLIAGLTASSGTTVYLGFLLMRQRRRPKEEVETEILGEDELDPRDRQVLKALMEGATTLSDVVKMTSLPKTTAYRRLKRLTKMGYIEEVRKEGKVIYQVKRNERK